MRYKIHFVENGPTLAEYCHEVGFSFLELKDSEDKNKVAFHVFVDWCFSRSPKLWLWDYNFWIETL